jgi:hypothetical protein
MSLHAFKRITILCDFFLKYEIYSVSPQINTHIFSYTCMILQGKMNIFLIYFRPYTNNRDLAITSFFTEELCMYTYIYVNINRNVFVYIA